MLAYLLAAGHGRRAGGPKAWRLHEGRALLERQLDFLIPRFGAPNVLVSIQAAWLDRCRALAAGVGWIAIDADAPPFVSLQALLAASPEEEPAFLHHVDMPVWDPAVFDALETAARARPREDAFVPTWRGRRGNPVLLGARARRRLAGEPPAQRLDAWLRSISPVEVPVEASCVVENWNFSPPRP